MKIIVLITAAIILMYMIFSGVKWYLFGKRRKLNYDELYADFKFKDTLKLEEFSMIIKQLGKCYHVPPEKLRLEDSFQNNLWKLDTWSLGGGSEDFEAYLVNKYDFKKEDGANISTIEDLLNCIAVKKKSRNA